MFTRADKKQNVLKRWVKLINVWLNTAQRLQSGSTTGGTYAAAAAAADGGGGGDGDIWLVLVTEK